MKANPSLAAIRPAAVAVLRRPSLWGTALVQLFRLAPTGWWHRRPFLPIPDPDYLRFRMETAYGRGDHAPEPVDVITYLRWCKAWPDR